MRISDCSSDVCSSDLPHGSYPEQCDIEGMKTRFAELLNLEVPLDDWLKEDTVDIEMIEERVGAQTNAMVAEKATGIEPATWRSEEHTSELQSLMRNSYAVFCLKKKKKSNTSEVKRQNDETITQNT